jgi:hypothetical protein
MRAAMKERSSEKMTGLADNEGGIETLSLPRAKPVEGNREVVHAHLRHRETFPEIHSPTFTGVRTHCPLCSL